VRRPARRHSANKSTRSAAEKRQRETLTDLDRIPPFCHPAAAQIQLGLMGRLRLSS
jgi:hypothetical protein